MKQIDDRACLNSTQPQLEGLTRCLTALVALSDDMSDDLSCRTYYQSARCMENLHADPNCDIEAFDNVIPDYVTTALMRTPDLLASLSVTSLPPAPKCSDYIKKAVDIKAPCLDKEFFGKYVIGRVCRKYVGHVLIEEVPKFTRCQYIVECGQTAMYEVFHANCTVEQVQDAINSTSSELQTLLPLAADSCEEEDSCSQILSKPEGLAASTKCFTYMYLQNTSLLTLEENCNFVLSGFACLRGELWKYNVSCPIRGLAQHYFSYVRYLASQNTTIFPFDITQCAAIVEKEGDEKIEDLCSNEDLIPLFVSTSYCALHSSSNDCSVLNGLVSCVKSSLNCSDVRPISNALITRSDVLVSRLGRNYSGCPADGGAEGSCSTMLAKPEGTAAGAKCFTYMFVQNTSLLTLEENCNFVLSGLACLREEMYKLGLSCTIRGLAQDYFNYIRLMASLNITIFPFDVTKCAAIVAKEGDGKIEDLCSNEELIPLFVSTSYCAFLAYSNDCGVLKGVTECVQSSMNCSDGSPITNALISRSDVLVKRLGKDYSKCPKEDEGGKKCPEQSDVDYSIAMDVVAECGAILGKFNASIIPEEHACRIFWGVVNCTLEELSKKGYDKCEKEIVEYVGNYLDTKNKTLKDVVPYNYKNCHFNKPTGDVCSNSGTLSYFAASSLECAPNTAVLIRKNNYTCGSLTFLVECVKEVLGKSEMKCRASTLHNNFYYNSYILQKYNKTLNFDNCESYAGNITSPDYYRPCPGLHISSIQC
ncbi:uncharacterized protein LOC124253453 isoform X3 [Haliotis rubra]|uniref:uncharacterized protein LOC124253453 isoform X3 n=1 Tax=Haliotis rubra TaxID=36100 RepID=UPI001EE5D4EC|nr:uncharacterized protein LOC124253453 isoform X3 [Haliotis rubra]